MNTKYKIVAISIALMLGFALPAVLFAQQANNDNVQQGKSDSNKVSFVINVETGGGWGKKIEVTQQQYSNKGLIAPEALIDFDCIFNRWIIGVGFKYLVYSLRTIEFFAMYEKYYNFYLKSGYLLSKSKPYPQIFFHFGSFLYEYRNEDNLDLEPIPFSLFLGIKTEYPVGKKTMFTTTFGIGENHYKYPVGLPKVGGGKYYVTRVNNFLYVNLRIGFKLKLN